MADNDVLLIQSGHQVIATHPLIPTADQKAALDAANAPTGDNPVATMADVGGGAGDITDPTDIAGLALWLDASQLALTDNDPVATWPDLSGNDFDATGTPADSVQTVDITGASSGDYELGFDLASGSQYSDPIAWNASAADVRTALEALPAIGIGNVTVTLLGQVYTVTFLALPIPLMGAIQDTLDVNPLVALVSRGYSGANRPVYKAAAQNGLSVVRFTAPVNAPLDAQWLDLTGSGLSLIRDCPGATVAVAFAQPSPTDPGDNIFLAVVMDDGVWRLLFDLTPEVTQASLQANDDAAAASIGSNPVTVVPSTAMTAYLGSVAATAGVAMAYATPVIGGAQLTENSPASGTAFRFADTPAAVVRIGQDANPTYITAGDLGELIVYTRALNAKERRKVLEYLSAKWATV